MSNEKNLKPFKKGNKLGKGRPRKFICILKEQGYKLSEINDALLVLLSMTKDEAKEVKAHPLATNLERMVVNAIEMSVKKGNLDAMETILSRAFGKPKQVSQITGVDNSPIQIVFKSIGKEEIKSDNSNSI